MEDSLLGTLRRLNRGVALLTGIVLMCCALFVLTDIVLRQIGSSVGGTDEISGYVMAIATDQSSGANGHGTRAAHSALSSGFVSWDLLTKWVSLHTSPKAYVPATWSAAQVATRPPGVYRDGGTMR